MSSRGDEVARFEPTATCAQCTLFEDDPGAIERAFTGMTALSSAYGSTRGSAGVCTVHGLFHDPRPACPEFAPRPAARSRR